MSKRHPNRRHIDLDIRPERIRRRNLNRMSIGLAVLFAVILGGTALFQRLAEEDPPTIVVPTPVGTMPPSAVTVDVVRIIDGDTLEVSAAGTPIVVRLFGVDTPERGEECYDEASWRLKQLAGLRVQLVPDQRLTDSFGRELRYVYASDGTLIDLALVSEGLGRAWTEDGALRDQIVAEEARARLAGRGCLWD